MLFRKSPEEKLARERIPILSHLFEGATDLIPLVWIVFVNRWSVALLTVVGVALGYWLVFVDGSSEKLAETHLADASSLMESENFSEAAERLEKAMELGSEKKTTNVYRDYASALAKAGNHEELESWLKTVAPDSGESSGDARMHLMRAYRTSQKWARKKEVDLNEFRWHLDNSVEPEEYQGIRNFQLAWARYYMAIKDPESAGKHFHLAAKVDPRIYVNVFRIYQQLKQKEKLLAIRKEARPVLERFLKSNPTHEVVRATLANCLIALKQDQQAEELLAKGIEISDSEFLKAAFSQFYVQQYARSLKKDPASSDKFYPVKMAFELSPQSSVTQLAIQRLHESGSDVQKTSIIRTLKEVATEPKFEAIAKSVIANIYWTAGESENAIRFGEETYALKPTPVSGNNLAFMIAETNGADLGRALELAKSAIEQRPRNPKFRDTLGTVLMKQGNLREAAVEFEKALRSKSIQRKKIHQKLEAIYQELRFDELAKRHSEKANESDTKQSPK